jgi:hypothetical protein
VETVFLFNCGRFAAKDGVERIAPETVEYPTINRDTQKIIRTDSVKLDAWDKDQWLKGYDHQVKLVAEAAKPKTKLTWIRNYGYRRS